jgi:hypothetical protein
MVKGNCLKVPERIRPMSSEAAEIEELGKRWVEAELAQDLAAPTTMPQQAS